MFTKCLECKAGLSIRVISVYLPRSLLCTCGKNAVYQLGEGKGKPETLGCVGHWGLFSILNNKYPYPHFSMVGWPWRDIANICDVANIFANTCDEYLRCRKYLCKYLRCRKYRFANMFADICDVANIALQISSKIFRYLPCRKYLCKYLWCRIVCIFVSDIFSRA